MVAFWDRLLILIGSFISYILCTIMLNYMLNHVLERLEIFVLLNNAKTATLLYTYIMLIFSL